MFPADGEKPRRLSKRVYHNAVENSKIKMQIFVRHHNGKKGILSIRPLRILFYVQSLREYCKIPARQSRKNKTKEKTK
jgi:hypothetical protein